MTLSITQNTSRNWKSLVALIKIILECVLAFSLVCLALEGLSRLAHLGKRPMIPFISDSYGNPRMPGHFSSNIKFPGGEPFKVCTDSNGLRAVRCDVTDANHGVLVVGDSQAMGWGMDFTDTYAYHVAQGLPGFTPDNVRAMAVAGADVESLQTWAAALPGKAQNKTKLNIITLNLGNDLDEMYFGRASVSVARFNAAQEWLLTHSVFMLDFMIFKSIVLQADWPLPPGANPVLFALNKSELEHFVDATVTAIDKLAKRLPPTERTVVLLLPNDYQINASEFNKYRRFYPKESQFLSWQRRVGEASKLLDHFESDIGKRLIAQGYRVAQPTAALKTFPVDKILDRSSHHFTRFGQTILAKSITDSLADNNDKH